MTNTVDPRLAIFAAKVSEAYDKVCEEQAQEFFDDYAPIGLEMTTINGLTVRFWEEGLEFYPEPTKTDD